MKKALITGVTGQDGSYLAELLLSKGYEVHGIKRRSSSLNTSRVDHIYENPHATSIHFNLHFGDLTDASSLLNILDRVQPDEIYNLGAQSHVAVSFQLPEYTTEVNALGTVKLLEAMRLLNMDQCCKFYQASTSELYGLVQQVPQTEKTPFYPRSPYAVSKLFAYWTVINYREAYDIFACNGILFNHESPRRGETFVTRKITRGLAHVLEGLEECLYLGNLDALRDWGHARDYVEMQWLMLQQDTPRDYVIASGQQASVREFVEYCSSCLDLTIEWIGKDLEERGVVKSAPRQYSSLLNKTIIRVDKRYFRPTEVDSLLGDASFARQMLGWSPQTSLYELASEMINKDLQAAKQEKLIRN